VIPEISNSLQTHMSHIQIYRSVQISKIGIQRYDSSYTLLV